LKPSTYQVISQERLVSANETTAVAATIPNGCSAILVTVETTDCRMTLTPSGDPTLAIGHVVPAGLPVWFLAIGQGCTMQFASMDVTASVIQLSYLQ
jgi:hypothetical protein